MVDTVDVLQCINKCYFVLQTIVVVGITVCQLSCQCAFCNQTMEVILQVSIGRYGFRKDDIKECGL